MVPVHKVVVDESFRSKLQGLDLRLELCDEAGRTLGYFVPASERQRLLYTWAQREFTDEEIERARTESGGFSIAQILADLAQS